MGWQRGENNNNAKLTQEDVDLIYLLDDERKRLDSEIRRLKAEIRRLKAERAELTSPKLAEKFGVRLRTIDSIVQGRTWG